MKPKVYIGWDRCQTTAWDIAACSLKQNASKSVSALPLSYVGLKASGLYKRPTQRKGARLFDTLSATSSYDGAMSTEHAIARFFIPHLVSEGWALFTDGDVLFRGDVLPLFRGVSPTRALYCVQHNYVPSNSTKMLDQVQTKYHRKNWSSVMLFNCNHPAHKRLTLDMLNTVPGRDLHRFCWLEDKEIGSLHHVWNYLVGHTKIAEEPKIVHFTEGLPNMKGYENCEYAEEWRSYGKICSEVGYQ